MSFLDRIAECNAHDLSRFRPFTIGGQQLGWVPVALLPVLAAFSDVFVPVAADGGVALHPRLQSFDERSAAVATVLLALEQRGLVPGWRNELYPVATGFAAPPLLKMERAATAQLGVLTYGVHMNGFVRRSDGIHLWVARRSYKKPTYPGMLDNTVAGGQPIGIGLHDNLVKECAEEAGIPAALARQARPVGVITYCHEIAEGLQRDAQFCFDLELPDAVQLTNTDGEVDAFMLWPIAKVYEVVRDTADFKFNCNLVIIDFLIRHGILPQDDPDYIEIARGLLLSP